EGVRRMTERILGEAGYRTLAAASAMDAAPLAARADLVLTDLIMPGWLGTELVDELRSARPELRVVYMSGYSHAILAHDAVAESPGTGFIEKPFTGDELLRAVRSTLDEAPA